MKEYLVTLQCGRKDTASSPTRRFCNPQCHGFFSRNLSSSRWQPKRKRREKPYLSSSSPLWDHARRRTTKDGYIQLRVVDRTTKELYLRMEHIIVWERHYGVRVPAGHLIHHRNEDRSNNHIVNLACMPRSSHTEMHAELTRLRATVTAEEYLVRRLEIVLRYEDEMFVPDPVPCTETAYRMKGE